ncbi:helix-turn-helix transcriptional regulator [Streptomyces hirsutus]|uniref:helix-turn-helix transcriptional regulator n=1 Tax=Streptomyces hirsutus TaxID=35620 RepID=UPI00367B7BB0
MDKDIVSRLYNGAEFRYRRVNVVKMSAEALGLKVGVTANSITRYETGVRTPTAYEVVVMAHTLGIPITDLTEKVARDPRAFLALLNLEKLRFVRDGEAPITGYESDGTD